MISAHVYTYSMNPYLYKDTLINTNSFDRS